MSKINIFCLAIINDLWEIKSMPKINIFWWVFLILVWGRCIDAAETPIPKKSVEIYAGGEKFNTLADYKLEKVKDFLRRAFALNDGQPLDDLLEKIQKENPGVDFTAMDEEQLQAIVEKMKKEEASMTPPTPQSDIVEMEEMLKEYQQKHREDEPTALDPHKVKTIVITPQGSGNP